MPRLETEHTPVEAEPSLPSDSELPMDPDVEQQYREAMDNPPKKIVSSLRASFNRDVAKQLEKNRRRQTKKPSA